MADTLTDDGTPVEGPDATNAFLQGAAEVVPDADGRVRVLRNGQFGSVPAEQLETFLRTTPGARLATQTELTERARSREYGEGVGAELRAAGEATARAATLGLSDVAIGELGGEEAREGLRERQARNPLAAGLGTALGVGATALATGGAGGLARGLSATPAGLALRAGAALEHTLGATTAVGRAGALAAGGALEGAIFGAGEGVSEWALNPDAQERTAERLMASMSERAGAGALLGGLAAGGLSLATSGLGKGGKAALDRIKRAMSKGEAEAVEGGAAAVAKRSASAEARAVDDVTLEVELSPTRSVPAGQKGPLHELAEGATARKRFADRQQSATLEIADDITALNRASDELVGRTGGVERKERVWRKLMDEDPPRNLDVTNSETIARLEALDDELAGASEHVHIYEKRGLQAFKAVREDIDQIANQMRMARTTDEVAENMRGLDRLKQRLGRVRASLESGAGADRGAAGLLNKHYENMRVFLEDGAVWGEKAADLQRDNNAHLSKWLDYSRSFEDDFALARGGRTEKSTSDPFQRIAEADPAKVGSALNRLGTSEARKTEEVLIEGARRQAEMLEALGKNLEFSPAEMAKVRAARKAADRIAKHADELKRLRVVGDRWDETLQRLADVPWVGGQLAKAKLTTGRTLALALEQGEAVEGAATRLGALHRVSMAARSVGDKITAGVERYARTIGSTAGRATRLTLQSENTRASRNERFEKAYASVREFEREPEAALRRAFRTQASLGTVAPLLASAYADKTLRAATFLASKAPGRDAATHLFARDQDDVKPDPRVSDDEKREFMKYVAAVEKPLSLLDELESGRVRPQTVEAVREVYPRLYQDIQTGILESLDKAKVTPPYRARLSLGILFDLPTDAALEPEFIQLLQATNPDAAAAPQEAQSQGMLSPSRRSAPELAGQVESRSAALANGL